MRRKGRNKSGEGKYLVSEVGKKGRRKRRKICIMRMKIFVQLRRRCTEKEKEEEEIFGEGKDMFCRREENGDGKGENLLEKENVTMADRLTDIVKIGLEFWTQNSKIMRIDRQTKPVSKSQIVKFYIFTLSHCPIVTPSHCWSKTKGQILVRVKRPDRQRPQKTKPEGVREPGEVFDFRRRQKETYLDCTHLCTADQSPVTNSWIGDFFLSVLRRRQQW